MAVELGNLFDKVSLVEEVSDVVVFDESWSRTDMKSTKSRLIERMVMNKPANREAMKLVLARVWQLEGDLEIETIADHTWVFQFGSPKDMIKLYVCQPWSFNRALIVFRKFDEDMRIEDYDFSWGSFWLQLHHIPLKFMTEQVARTLGSKARLMDEVEAMKKDCVIAFLGGNKVKVDYKYEKLSDFCYMCTCLNHT